VVVLLTLSTVLAELAVTGSDVLAWLGLKAMALAWL